MLGLKLATDPRWVNIVESNIEEILTDHAWCEQKAASNAISLVTNNSELEELVTETKNTGADAVEHIAEKASTIAHDGAIDAREQLKETTNNIEEDAD